MAWVGRVAFAYGTPCFFMGKAEVEWFLTCLAAERGVSASTRNQAFSALLFLNCHVLEVELDWIGTWSAPRSRTGRCSR
ncbi:phage integrase N-terminal SAM-like domain-containing protein [Thiohalomonas denitrificans]|uniref:phage integrase N-terminal SAM-like domain-containing protein n=1 Tax=Thiohalomonas denitrificans TaxID=415747 RepID=UPI0029500742|nr:phage integrase N-terminal SAM-like domain-containing protein [Thiohalomonas denitrificans]